LVIYYFFPQKKAIIEEIPPEEPTSPIGEETPLLKDLTD